MEDLLSTVAEIAERLARIETRLDGMFTAWSSGGLKALRAHAKGYTNGA